MSQDAYKCNQHIQKTLEYICIDSVCQKKRTPLCISCLREFHPRHIFKTIKEVQEDSFKYQDLIIEFIQKKNEEQYKMVDNIIKELENMKNKYNQCIQYVQGILQESKIANFLRNDEEKGSKNLQEYSQKQGQTLFNPYQAVRQFEEDSDKTPVKFIDLIENISKDLNYNNNFEIDILSQTLEQSIIKQQNENFPLKQNLQQIISTFQMMENSLYNVINEKSCNSRCIQSPSVEQKLLKQIDYGEKILMTNQDNDAHQSLIPNNPSIQQSQSNQIAQISNCNQELNQSIGQQQQIKLGQNLNLYSANPAQISQPSKSNYIVSSSQSKQLDINTKNNNLLGQIDINNTLQQNEKAVNLSIKKHSEHNSSQEQLIQNNEYDALKDGKIVSQNIENLGLKMEEEQEQLQNLLYTRMSTTDNNESDNNKKTVQQTSLYQNISEEEQDQYIDYDLEEEDEEESQQQQQQSTQELSNQSHNEQQDEKNSSEKNNAQYGITPEGVQMIKKSKKVYKAKDKKFDQKTNREILFQALLNKYEVCRKYDISETYINNLALECQLKGDVGYKKRLEELCKDESFKQQKWMFGQTIHQLNRKNIKKLQFCSKEERKKKKQQDSVVYKYPYKPLEEFYDEQVKNQRINQTFFKEEQGNQSNIINYQQYMNHEKQNVDISILKQNPLSQDLQQQQQQQPLNSFSVKQTQLEQSKNYFTSRNIQIQQAFRYNPCFPQQNSEIFTSTQTTSLHSYNKFQQQNQQQFDIKQEFQMEEAPLNKQENLQVKFNKKGFCPIIIPQKDNENSDETKYKTSEEQQGPVVDDID